LTDLVEFLGAAAPIESAPDRLEHSPRPVIALPPHAGKMEKLP
jgi:hypothetical protein